jgi:N utilization substance protein B
MQIASIDRNILRLAIYEVLLDNKVPMKAAINEAVDLAKAFGSDSSAKFVNGVLGSVAAEKIKTN